MFDEAVVPELAALRHRFDPVMAATVPPHITVVYPEEYTDVELLIERTEAAAARTNPFTMSGIDFVTDGDNGRGGVFAGLDDASGTWERLRSELLAPPFSPLAVRPHITVVHPRTSPRGVEAWGLLAGNGASCHVVANTLRLTVTDPVGGLRTVERFPLRGSTRALCAGVMLVDGPRILLARRHPDRTWYPGLWDVVGGHIDAGDSSPVDAARREAAEELGVTIDATDLKPVATTIGDDYELVLFATANWQGTPDNRSPLEHAELSWFLPSQTSTLDLADPEIGRFAAIAVSQTTGG